MYIMKSNEVVFDWHPVGELLLVAKEKETKEKEEEEKKEER